MPDSFESVTLASVHSWRIEFSAPGVTLSQGWNGNWTDTGDVIRVTNVAWNGPIATGASVTVGYNASFSGGGTPPFGSAKLNGAACA